jgi:GT2 family glycosyltransferase
VVAVVVVHEPGDWFEEMLEACADQDYPNLRFLFLVTEPSAHAGTDLGEVAATVEAHLPDAFVRSLGSNPGFAASANEVTRLVDGENGFFLICHDDVAPAPDAVRLMVEELYRSNAGVVGPKLVEWEDPGVLLSVGMGLDRFGEIDQPIEPGEVDQEQHDGVRDVFVVPSACMLVRADLFRELGGFDEAMWLYGEDTEFCWRVHHSGARVVVAPSARVRHRAALPERRPDINHVRIAERHRLRAVTTMTGAGRLPVRLMELILLAIASFVLGPFTGRFRSGMARVLGLFGLIPRIPSIVARRREVADARRVPESEVLDLQRRGSARINSFLRRRETSTYVGSGSNVRRWRESSTAPLLTWLTVLVFIVIGSRTFLGSGVPAVGEFYRFPESPADLFGRFVNGWNPTGVGASEANPTGMAALSIGSVATLFRMGMLHTLFIVGLVVVGLIGLWKLVTVFPSTRARVAALVVYAASPLVSGALGTGALDVLVVFATVPWVVHTLRRAVGIETADPRTADSGVADGLVDLAFSERVRRTVQVGIVIALGSAFAPVTLVVSLAVGLAMCCGTLLALAPLRTSVYFLGATIAGTAIGALLNVPWIGTWSWDAIVGPSPVGDPDRGIRALASFEIGPTDLVSLSLALYVPVVAALLLSRAWRLTWAVRATVLIGAFGAFAVLGDRGSLPVAAPEAGILLVPVAVGLALAAATSLAAFESDVRGGSFGWRQPLGIAATCAVAVGIVPGVLSVTAGDWDAPSPPLSELIEARLPSVPEDGPGDYNVLLLGDARLLPVPGTEYRDGVSFAVIIDDDLDVAEQWAPTDAADDIIVQALDQISAGSTQRAGRLLAPLGIRFVAVPEIDGITSTTADPLEMPTGLVESFDQQLDIVSVVGLPTVEFFENTSWLPSFALLEGEAAEASREEGAAALVRVDLSGSQPIFSGADSRSELRNEVRPGVVHLAVPFDDRWTLAIDGESIEPRVAFGVTTAFDVEQAGVATLSYDTPGSRVAMLILQALLWLAAVFVAARVTVPLVRRSGALVDDETLMKLDGDDPERLRSGVSMPPVADPGHDMMGQVARVSDDESSDPTDGIEMVVPEPSESVSGSDLIDELPWVDELMDRDVADPISVVDDNDDEGEGETR